MTASSTHAGRVQFASCDGCQLTLLDREVELLSTADHVCIEHFLEATRAVGPGPYDLGAECGKPFQSIVVRAVETLHAVDEALRGLHRSEVMRS